MSIIQALLLGLVQGLTEFLPVSSSGHLALIEHLFQSTSQKGLLFEVLLHIGTLVAILAAFRQDLKKLFWESCKSVYDLWENIRTYFHNRNHQDAKRYKKIISNNYRKLFLLLFVTTVPTVIEGLWLENAAIQARGNLLAPATGFFLTGVLLLVVDFFPAGNKIPKDVGYGAALLIGIAQGFAVFPGVSRSGITITACMLLGFNRSHSGNHRSRDFGMYQNLRVPDCIGNCGYLHNRSGPCRDYRPHLHQKHAHAGTQETILLFCSVLFCIRYYMCSLQLHIIIG